MSSAPLLLAVLLVGGLGSAAVHPASASVARAALAGRSGLAVGLFGAGGAVGLALGPLIALAVVAWPGPPATPWLMFPGFLIGSAALLLIPSTARGSSDGGRPKLLNRSLFAGPVGLLALTEVASSLAYLTFASTMPLWLLSVHGVARDAALIGWTLATFSFAAALGGIAAGLLAPRLGRRLLVGGTTLLAPLPLFALFEFEPGSWTYFASAALAGGLVNAGLPLKIVTAQDLAPKAVAAASGMVLGFAMGVADLLYVGVGILQEAIGLAPAMSVAYATLVPAALLAFVVLGRPDLAATPAGPVPAALSLAGLPCSRWYAASERASAVGTAPPLGGPGRAGAAASVEGPAACTRSVGVGGRAQDCRWQRATVAVA